jgi:TRAP-type C4-dicarboxylate transport system permease small subunit
MDGDLREKLLFSELQQNYSWMQELLKHLLAWYAFFFTANIALIGYLVKDGARRSLGPLPPLMMFLDTCGLLLILVAWRYFTQADGRTRSLVDGLNGLAKNSAGIAMRSVFPGVALKIGFLFLAFGLIALAVVWGTLL